ncbi:lysophospholipid acyltransferase family protein [Pareuzebyella sediminis]|uniref:lysophospholipid acyltransferase family protein n=1 Tax=Pareuzebyella sediminis TaxID=2607998 RepID=UPI0011F09067|nr:lipid A biosynthesis acyltransferase [Pareuzebyella sediminis]
MQLLVFILAYPLLWLISILPQPLLYAFSDFVFFIVYHVVGYRKNVVRENLELVFPQKSKKEIDTLQKSFFRHMCDMFIEMVKTMNLSKAEVEKRYAIQNIEEIKEIEKTKSIIILCAHYANWEWNVSINNYVESKGYAVYQKIGNVYFDRWVRKVRAKWNTTLLTQKQVVKTAILNQKNEVRSTYGMVSDQSPQKHLAYYWTDFMGVTVPVIGGGEILARKLDLAVFFLKVSKVKRGYYQAELIPITYAGATTEAHEITDKFLRLVEQQISEKPEHYLWTHRRWKHRNDVPEKFR